MKEFIGKLSRGTIEYDVKTANSSVNKINVSMRPGEVYKGTFEVNSSDENAIKGIIYASEEHLEIINNQFSGVKNTIEYQIDGSYFEGGQEINGRINIVSNGGELNIPYSVKVTVNSLDSESGPIDSIFSFVELAKKDIDAAVKVFLSADFQKVVLKDDLELACIYHGVLKGNNARLALEEFLVTINKKQDVEISISDTKKDYEYLQESYGDSISISMTNRGYVDIKVEVQGDFITNYKDEITDEDFAGNVHEFSYLIDVARLHAGMNYGTITFKTINETYTCRISVDNRKERDKSKLEIKKCFNTINCLYIQFRLHEISVDTWGEKTLETIERARGFNDNIPFLKLLQAQVYVTKGRDEEAKWLLDSVADEVIENKDKDVVIYCYYLYVRTLHRKELEQTIRTTEIIRKYYENGYDSWKLLWILLFIDTSYENNKSLKLTRIKEQYNIGCRSNLMYYEALYVLNKQPVLMRVINDFELQVLNFGAKYNAIDFRLAMQITEVAAVEKKFRPLLFNVLRKLYEKYKDKNILASMVSILIKGNVTDSRYFEYYALAIKEDIQITRLYEYYVFSMPQDYDGDIPNTILMYYVYNGSQLFTKEAFFYTLIIKNKDRYPNVYNNYKRGMEFFALEKIRHGEIDENLAIVYKDVLLPEMVRDENAAQLISIMNTWVIKCDNKNIRSVTVIYKEVQGEKTYLLNEGKAYIQLYTQDAFILLSDVNGNVYNHSVDYELKKLYDDPKIREAIPDNVSNSVYILASKCEKIVKQGGIQTLKDAEILRSIDSNEEFRRLYKKQIVNMIVDYYYNNYDGEDIIDYLKSLNVSVLGNKERNKLIEVMITVGMYNYAGDIMDKYGFQGIDSRKIMKYCVRILRTPRGENEDKYLLRYCNYAFLDGKYNEPILSYLCTYFNGTTGEMLEMWRISKSFAFESRDLEERLIAQMLFTRTHLGSLTTVYDSYYKKGGIEMIRYAYLFYLSYSYFVNEEYIDEMFFKHLGDELSRSSRLMDLCKCAYLKHYSEKKNLSEGIKEVAKECIEYLEKRKIIFDFYKKYARFFRISANIADKTTIVYKTRPKDKVLINYYIDNGYDEHGEYVTEEMNRYFAGVYVKAFTLFYGEKINYYISQVEDGKMTFSEQMVYEAGKEEINTDSRYGMLNKLSISLRGKEKDKIAKTSDKYFMEKNIIDKLF